MPIRLATLLLAMALSAAAQLSQTAPPDLEQPLIENVSDFYGFFQKGEFRQAEGFLDEESKDTFYIAKKNRIMSFEIKSIDWSEDFRQANVLVTCQTMVPLLGSAPMSVPLSSDWRLTEGEWRMHLPARKLEEGAKFPSPAGDMEFNQTVPGSPAPPVRPTLASLAQMYSVDQESVRFKAGADAESTEQVLVRNSASGNLTVRRVGRPTAGLKVTVDAGPIGPGEEAKIVFTHQPARAQLSGDIPVEFLVSPINQRFTVLVQF